jgi:hypothetical protein
LRIFDEPLKIYLQPKKLSAKNSLLWWITCPTERRNITIRGGGEGGGGSFLNDEGIISN